MSMWDSDRIFGGLRLDQEYEEGEHFVLDDIEIVAEDVDMDNGNDNLATKTQLHTRKLNDDGTVSGDPLVVGTFSSAIAEKARIKADGDLPAVVSMMIIPSKVAGRNDARVIQFIRPWEEPKDKRTAKQKAAAKDLPLPF